MRFEADSAEIFVPDGLAPEGALARATCMGIGAHHDDLEIMAIDGILHAFESNRESFAGVVVTDGSGSPRAGAFADCSDEEMKRVRVEEQKKAASVGKYGIQVMLGYPSSDVKDSGVTGPVNDIRSIIKAGRPETVYTHNPMDKHDTHVAVFLRVIEAIRGLPADERPAKVYGGEVWRDLDWVLDDRKVVFDCSGHEDLQAQLVAVFESQIAGGKRYDLAALARQRANATYYASHGVDTATALTYAVDLTPLIDDDALDPGEFSRAYVDELREDVLQRIKNFR